MYLRTASTACGLMMLCCLGCSSASSRADLLIKQQIELINELAGTFEQGKDTAEIKSVMDKSQAIDLELVSLAKDVKDVAMKANQQEYESALGRLKKAKDKSKRS